MTKNTITKMAAIAALIFLNIFIFSANARAQFGGGSGSYYDPYIISSIAHMTKLANDVKGGENYIGKHFLLDADLDYTGQTYTVIGDAYDLFLGSFHGNGHTISGVQIDKSSAGDESIDVGLFGGMYGDIDNLTLSDSYIKARIIVGGIVGDLVGGNITNCHVTSDVTIEVVHMYYDGFNQPVGEVGGIVGYLHNKNSHITDCTCAATLIAPSGSDGIGGIVGSCGSVGGAIEDCAYTGTINFGGTEYVGGIVGKIYNSNATVTNNYIGGACTLGAIGVQGSTQGTDAGSMNTTHLHTIRFNSAQYVTGTIATQPTMNIGGTDYYASGSTISLSSLSTFGGPGSGNIWSFRATVSYSYYEEIFRQEDGTWQFTMPVGNAIINPAITKDISLYTTSVTLTPASATYTGSSHKPTVSVTRSGVYLTEGTDFVTDIPTAGYTNPGDYTFHIWGINEYGGMRTETFTVAHAALTQLTLSETMVYYDGAAHTPTLTVKSGSKTLTLGTEYQTNLPAGGFTDLGNYTIKAWGVGNYSDTVTATFTICHPWNGMGTDSEPFLIQNEDDMDRLATLVNGGKTYEGVFFRQTHNLDYTGKTYTPVGNADNRPFQGTYNGDARTMTGINVNQGNYVGVFGHIGSQGTVRSLSFAGTNSFSGSYVAGSIAGWNFGTIDWCFVQIGANVSVNSGDYGGGIAGANYGTINQCDNRANVTANCAGGIAGLNSNNGTITGMNYATVTGIGACGGIVGENDSGTITGQHEGSVNCTNNYGCCGGIVGFNLGQGVVEYCLSNDLMTAVVESFTKGAIAGRNDGTLTSNYYIGACKFEGLGNVNNNTSTDVTGQAMRGWPIIAEDIVHFQPDYCDGMAPGTYYNDEVANTNYYYVGAGETLPFMLGSLEFSNMEFAANGTALASAGLNSCNETYYSMVMPAQSVTITLLNLPTLELFDDDSQEWPDNDSRISMNDGLNCNVQLNGRTFYKDGRWNLLCLPFDLSDITGTPLEGAEVRTMAVTSTYANGILSLGFTDPLTAMEAGKPYLVRWASGDNITDPVFNNITIVGNTSDIVSGDNNIRFVGNYTNTSLDANTTEYLYFDADCQLHYPYGADYDLSALRGHFEITLENNVQVGTCTVDLGTPSTYSMLPAIFQTNGDWNTAANWNTGALPAEGADVLVMAEAEVPSGYVANVGSIKRDGWYGSITVKDGGQLYHTNDGVWATVEKGITTYSSAKDGWHLIASPLTANVWPQQWNGFTANEYDLYYYDEPTHYWINHKDQTDGDFYIEPLKGYLYANSQDDTLVFQDNLRAGNAMVNVPLNYTSTLNVLKGFNLVGNPFAHNVTAFTGNGVADEVYRMNGDGSELVVDAISAASPLKPCEGFFVKATGDNASLAFNDSGAKGEKAKQSFIALEIGKNGKLVDRFILKTDGNPLEKFTLNERSTRIFATNEGQDWAVSVIASDSEAIHTEQPINFKAEKNGTYTLTVNTEGMNLDYLHLIDNLTGADVDLLQTPDYTFTAKTTDYASRFRLVFNVNDNGDNGDDAPFAYINNGNIIITTGACDASLQVVDMMGRIVYCRDAARHVSTDEMVPGMYVLRLIEGDSIRTQKMIIR